MTQIVPGDFVRFDEAGRWGTHRHALGLVLGVFSQTVTVMWMLPPSQRHCGIINYYDDQRPPLSLLEVIPSHDTDV